jgi:hypothetical protein
MKVCRYVVVRCVNPGEGNRFLGWKVGEEKGEWMTLAELRYYRSNSQWKVVRVHD